MTQGTISNNLDKDQLINDWIVTVFVEQGLALPGSAKHGYEHNLLIE